MGGEAKTKKNTIKPKKTKPFFGPKKKLDVKLNKTANKGKATPSPLKKAVKKEKAETKKLQILSLKKPIKEIQATSKKHQKHKESDLILKEAQSAAILPSEKANQSAANHNQVAVVMGDQTKDTKTFNKEGFEKKLKEQINATIIRKEDADEIKRNGVDENVTKKVSSTVGEEKTNAGGKIEASSIVAPATPATPSEEATTQEPQMLGPVVPEAKSLTAQKTDLAPVKHPEEETDFTKETAVLGDDYKQNNLSQDKLQNSNEPRFIAADNQKQDSETKAQELTDQTRANEKKKINSTRSGNTNSINDGYNAMVQKQDSINKGRSNQQSQKSIEENKIRQDVYKQLNDIFNLANTTVLECFKDIDTYIQETFGKSLTQNLDLFSEQVSDLLDDNDGIEWLGKKLTGSHVQDEIEIFNVAKRDFITHMQDPINDLVDYVDKKLSKANQAIIDGRNNAKVFWDKQSDETKRIADDIFKESDSKFGELETSVESKEGAIIDTVTEKFNEALTQLDERFEKAKIENMSWLDRAIAAVKSVINTIIELKNAIQSLAQKAAKYAEAIIDDPITFFGNLADGVGQGFTNFKNNIDKHLVKGVLEWLTGSMAGSDIILPKELNLEGITSLVLQILGITMKKIKDLVIDVIGKERFEFIEKGVDATLAAGNKILNIFKILNEKGLAGLWEFIQEEFSNLKEMLIENVKTFVVETITMKALEYLLSLLIPGAGFIRAAQLLIKFVITLFQKAAQIIKIIDGILDTFGDILNKNLGAVIEKVESVFSGFLSLAISFLAAVLGLDGIVGKVQKFIQQKIRPKIDQILKNIAGKIKKIVEKIGLTKLIDKSMHAVEKGKAWVDDKKKKAKEKAKELGDKVLEFLGFKKKFSLGSESHTLLFEEKNGEPVFYVHSTPSKYKDFIKGVAFADAYTRGKTVNDKYGKATPGETAKEAGRVVDVELGKYEKTPNEDRKKWGNGLVVHMNNIADVITKYAEIGDKDKDVPSIVEWTATNPKGLGKKVDAKQLSANYIEGQETAEQGDGGGLTDEWDIISQNKGNNSTYYYVRGHLLNAKVGGIVNNTNLTPLAKNTNKEHLKNVERDAKKIVTGQKSASDTKSKTSIIRYSVEAIYGQHPIRSIPNLKAREKTVKDMEETKGVIPTSLKFSLKKLTIEAGKVVVDDSFDEIKDSIPNELPPVVKLKT